MPVREREDKTDRMVHRGAGSLLIAGSPRGVGGQLIWSLLPQYDLPGHDNHSFLVNSSACISGVEDLSCCVLILKQAPPGIWRIE